MKARVVKPSRYGNPDIPVTRPMASFCSMSEMFFYVADSQCFLAGGDPLGL
jgi:hypothetical protein